MKRIDELKDETVKTLAKTLKDSGLAASETEAIRMASNMTQTNKKANDTFEERREKNTMGLSFLHKEEKEKNKNENVVREEVFAQESPNEGEEEAHDDCSSCSGCDDGLVEDKPLNELFESNSKDEFIEQDLLKEEKESESVPETTKEVTSSSDDNKKDLSEYEESNVDLGSVFKFSN